MCKANGKFWADYWRLGSTKEYLDALSAETGIPVSALVEARKGGGAAAQGTWVHPDIAIHLVQWSSRKFAVQVETWYHTPQGGTRPVSAPVEIGRTSAASPGGPRPLPHKN